jgi:hypothetical protein
MLVSPMLLGAFQPRKPAPGEPAPDFPWDGNQELSSIVLCPATHCVSQQDPVVGLRWLKSSERHGRDMRRRGPSTPRYEPSFL